MAKAPKPTTIIPTPDLKSVVTIVQIPPGYALVEMQIDVNSDKIVSYEQISEPDLLQITVGKLQQKLIVGT